MMQIQPGSRQPNLQAILLQEEKTLSVNEEVILQRIWKKKILFIGATYLAFVVVLVVAWVYGPEIAARNEYEERLRYEKLAPPLIIFFFVLLTVYFIRYYLRSAHPFWKDVKKGVKELIYFEPKPYKTPFFDRYYIQTISKKRAMVQISKEMYDAILPGAKACIALSPYARFVFSIHVDDKTMLFNEKNSILDM